jgi:ribA/ribD-fused uncharacterized protein
MKASTIGSEQQAQNIFNAEDALEAKKLSKELNDSDPTWQEIKENIMIELIQQKIQFCPEFKKALIESGTKILAESTRDRYWASGLNRKLTGVTNPEDFPGRNILGNIMMAERRKLLVEIEISRHKLSKAAMDLEPQRKIQRSSSLSSCDITSFFDRKKRELEITPTKEFNPGKLQKH